jgi:hypothetical protein
VNLRTLLLTAVLLSATGCAAARFNNAAFQADVARGDYATALKQIDAVGGKDDVSFLLDRGLLLQSLGRYEESNAVFEKADALIADLYTRSLSKEAASLLVNDLALDYRASAYEAAYISYYRAWNYLQMGLTDDVLVEARRINQELDFRSASCLDEQGACGHDVFLRYFSGLLFEWGGEDNDAYVAYKQADLARASSEASFGTPPPPDLGPRLVRLARRLGFTDEEEVYAQEYGVDPDAVPTSPSSVVVVFENGMVGRRVEASLTIPILKGETKKIAEDPDRWSRRLAGRRHQHYEDVKLDYLLRVALPSFVQHPPEAARAEFRLGPISQETGTVESLSARAEAALNNAMGGILIRAVSRALAKYLASRAADKEIGEGAGVLVNLIGAATEMADTRSWRSLPYEIQVAALTVPPGEYQGDLTLLGPSGQVLNQQAFPDIRVPKAGVAFVRYRSGL